MRVRNKLVYILCLMSLVLRAQEKSYDTSDSLLVRAIFDEALLNGKSYDQLNYLCKAIGHRITGSPQAELALEWAQSEVSRYNVDRLMMQNVQAEHWVRGDKEWVAISEDVDLLL